MYFGQAEQDKFVLNVLKNKNNGTFVEIGSNNPVLINNTYLLEKSFGWKGIMIEYDSKYLDMYKQHRPGSIWVIDDARKINYLKLFETAKMPKTIDYLQIDLEANNGSTLETLKNLDNNVLNQYKFATVTFEHDVYCCNKNVNQHYGNTREESREIFNKHGYLRVFGDVHNLEPQYVYEDWYVYPELVDMDYVNLLIEKNKTKYMFNNITQKSINWKEIEY